MRTRALVLGLLAGAFLARVLGQVVVVVWAPSWLPPMGEWYSGLVPYPVLFLFQLLILALQVRVSYDLWRGHGLFARPYPGFGRGLVWFAWIYFGVMVLRYLLTMILFPERRWLGGTIPIFFHWVLAVYLMVWSGFHREARVKAT